MKRLLTYLSAIIIMMMVPIGAMAETHREIYLSSQIWGWNNCAAEAKFSGGTGDSKEYYIDIPAATFDSYKDGENYLNFRLHGNWDENSAKWGIYPVTNKTVLTAGAGYSSDVYSTGNTETDDKKDYYWRIARVENATNYRIYYKYVSDTESHIKYEVTTSDPVTPTTGDGNFYLVGNFFNTDDETNINYNNRYFKFNKQSDGSYMVEIPATVTANTQILCVEGSTTSIYGPGQAAYGLHAADGSAVGWPATDGYKTGNLTKSTTLALNNNYWKLTTRNNDTSAGDDDGLYEVSFTLNSSGVPSNWTIKHVSTKRVVYFLSTATGAVATPLYDKRNDANAAYTNATKGYLHFDASNQYWVLSNIVYKDIIENTGSYDCGTKLGAHKNNRNRDILPTTNKLVYKGNGNRVFATDKLGNEVSPNEQAIAANYLSNNQNATYEVQYNPSNGDGDLAKSHWGMRGQIQFLGGTSADDNIKSVSMVGPAIPGTTSGTTWNWASTAGDMTWDVTENCYKLTLTTTAPAGEHFRFVANHAQAKNFYETNTTARIPYDGTATSGTSAATEEDPNDVAYTTSGTTSYTDSSYDILFNRPAGEWTVRFYLTYDKEQNKSFYYTITGTENTNPDATLKPGTDGGNYDFDNYETGTAETLDVTLSNATKYAYAIGANSSVTLDESSTKTDGSFTLTYDGTNVTDGFGNVVTGNTVYVKIQGQDDSDNKGTTHTYQYTFNVPSSTFYFTPKGGLFINSAKITVNGGTEPYTYTVKDASGNVRSTGNFVLAANDDEDNYRISTPGYLTVTDALGNTATSNELFDFTYSTSENYKNYNNNATVSKIIQTGGGQGALNVFINKNDDLETLWLYAYNKTLDAEWKAQHGEPAGDAAKQAALDKEVRLTSAFPGDNIKDADQITIDGIKYVHFTIPKGNLREGDKVAIIVSQGTEDKEYWYTQTTDAGKEIERTEDPAFIYNIKNSPSGTPSSGAETGKGTNTLLKMAEDGSRTIFFTKPSGWTAPIYCHSWIPNTTTETQWKATNEKMTVYNEDIYTYTVPNDMTKVMFVDANGNQTTDGGTDYSGGRIHYTWDGSTLSPNPATGKEAVADLEELTTFLNTPPTTTVVTQRYPNGEDYWRAAPGDLSIKLDPTWGITGGLGNETSVTDWAGNVPKRVNANQVLTQTIQGLNAGKTYTVQAIVRGLGENKKTVTLTLEGAETVTKTLNLRNGGGGSESSADLSRQGSEITRTGRVEYIEPLVYGSAGYKYKENDDNYKNLGSGWAKVEATVNASQAGWLTISLTGNEWFNLSQVTLLEDANTDHGFRTTASKSATDTELANVDFRDRSWKKNNAYSFFDRGKNRNAVIFANDRTVIAMNSDHLADDQQNAELKAIDRRHPFNVVGIDEDDSNPGTAKALYLTDMGYGGDENSPVDYKIGDTSWETYNSTNYRKSGYTFQPYLEFNAEDVILDRTPGVSEKKQTTIMLPFGISVAEMKEYYTNELRVWDYKSYDSKNKTITFNEVTDNLTANKPYILTGANGTLDSRGKNKAKKTVAQVDNTTHHTASNHAGFTGTYEYKVIERSAEGETRYGYNPTTGKFQIAAATGASLKPFRAYFTLPVVFDQTTSARELTVIFDDVITGISESVQVNVEPTNVYTLGGVLVARNGDLSRLPKGVYIVNGKKVIK